MNLAIVGSREYTNYEEFKSLLEKSLIGNISKVKLVVTGGAKGVDSMAEKWAADKKIETKIFLPLYKSSYDPGAPLKRNSQIVEASNIMVAFVAPNSRGTLDSIKKAEKKGIVVKIHYINT